MPVAGDTNVPLELAQGVRDVADALGVIHERIAGARLIATPTVALEPAYLSEFADEADVRASAQTALRSLAAKQGIQPVNLVPDGQASLTPSRRKSPHKGCCRMRRHATR